MNVVISNGVINSVGGRIADTVSSRPIKAQTVAEVELWAACVAGAAIGFSGVCVEHP